MIKAYPCEDGSTIVTDINRLPVCKLKKMHTILNKPTGQEFECEIVMVYDERGHFAMMPTECLDFS
jgi:hypothetical protein